MILDLAYISKDLYAFNQIKSKPMYLSSLVATSLYIKGFYYLVNILISTKSIIRPVTLTKLTFAQKISSSYV